MNKLIKTVVVAAVAAFVTPAVTNAAVPATATQNVPGTMNYQGYLADPSTGTPYADGIYTLDIRIWDSAANKTGCLWGGKYTVYVKGGYFNIMLGDPNATALTVGVVPTYSNTELWKALWGSSATDNVRYLGVTPYQSATHAAIPSPIEIAPRQQLLSSPFAFRAQHAQYADQAQSDFSVPGNLAVSGTATFNGTVNMPSGSSVGPLVSSSSQVKLTGNTSAGSTQPNVYDVGKYLYFYSYYSMYFQPTAGNIQFSVPSGYNMSVTGAGTFKSDAVNNKIGGTGYTQISGTGNSYISLTGSSAMKLKTTSTMDLEAGGENTVKGSNVSIEAPGGLVKLLGNPSSDSWGVKGQGDVQWCARNSTGSAGYPIRYYEVTITIPVSYSYKTSDLSSLLGSNSAEYRWSVVGYCWTSGANIALTQCYMSGTTLKISVPTPESYTRTFKVYLMGVSKCFGMTASQITAP